MKPPTPPLVNRALRSFQRLRSPARATTNGLLWAMPPIVGGEIYFIDYLDDGTFSAPRRGTANTYTDIFPALSPDGKGKSVFDGALIGTGMRQMSPPTEEQHHE